MYYDVAVFPTPPNNIYDIGKIYKDVQHADKFGKRSSRGLTYGISRNVTGV